MKMMGDNDQGGAGADSDGGDETEDEREDGIWQQTLTPTSLHSTAASCLPHVGACDTCDIR